MLQQMILPAGKCAVDALLEAGHDKIGIIGGDPVKSYTSHQRYLGCKESFAEHGKEMDLEVCYEKARFSFDSAYRAMKRLVEKYSDLTAVFAMSDVMAYRRDPCAARYGLSCTGRYFCDWF